MKRPKYVYRESTAEEIEEARRRLYEDIHEGLRLALGDCASISPDGPRQS